MDDLIKREDAIKAVWKPQVKPNELIFDALKTAIESEINNVPSADRPKREWIPCSERLPSEQGQYLVTFPLCNGDPWVYVLSFCKGKFYETDDEWGDVEYDDVAAWMPLPEPWKGADDE